MAPLLAMAETVLLPRIAVAAKVVAMVASVAMVANVAMVASVATAVATAMAVATVVVAAVALRRLPPRRLPRLLRLRLLLKPRPPVPRLGIALGD